MARCTLNEGTEGSETMIGQSARESVFQLLAVELGAASLYAAPLVTASLCEWAGDGWTYLGEDDDCLARMLPPTAQECAFGNLLAEHIEAVAEGHELVPFAPRILSLTHGERPVGNYAGLELLYEGPAFKRPTLITLIFGNADAYRASLAGWPDDRRVQVSGALIEALIAQVSTAPIGATIH